MLPVYRKCGDAVAYIALKVGDAIQVYRFPLSFRVLSLRVVSVLHLPSPDVGLMKCSLLYSLCHMWYVGLVCDAVGPMGPWYRPKSAPAEPAQPEWAPPLPRILPWGPPITFILMSIPFPQQRIHDFNLERAWMFHQFSDDSFGRHFSVSNPSTWPPNPFPVVVVALNLKGEDPFSQWWSLWPPPPVGGGRGSEVLWAGSDVRF